MTRRTIRLSSALVISIALVLLTINLHAADTGSNTPGSRTIRILTIGNSFAENACMYLQAMTESVPGCEIIISKANIGGCSLEKHATLILACEEDSTLKPYNNTYTLKEIIDRDEYDYVTIQQVSHLSFKSESYQPYADTLYNFIKRHAPGAKIIIHQTWAYSKACHRLTDLGISRDDMHRGLLKNYTELGEKYNIDMLPSGNAFYASFKKNPEIYLWSWGDGFHANQNGCYLAGCVWFATLFGISPTEISYVPGEIGPKTAKYLRKIAFREVKKL